MSMDGPRGERTGWLGVWIENLCFVGRIQIMTHSFPESIDSQTHGGDIDVRWRKKKITMKPCASEKSLKHAPPLLTCFDAIELLLLLFTNLWYLKCAWISATEPSSNTVQSRLYTYFSVAACDFRNAVSYRERVRVCISRVCLCERAIFERRSYLLWRC